VWYYYFMTSQRGFVATALLIVVAAMFVTGGVYIYSKTKQELRENELILAAQEGLQASQPTEQALQLSADLAWARTRLQMESGKLNDLKEQSRVAAILNSALKDTYLKINDAVKINLATPSKVSTKLTTTQKQITQILDKWQALVAAGTSAQQTIALQTAIHTDLPTINSYLHELSAIVNNLTPSNSGLTQQQISQLQTAVTTATQEVVAAANTLTQTETQVAAQSSSSGSQSNSGTQTSTSEGNTQTQIQNQQQVVNNLQEQVEQLAQQLQQQQQNQNTSGNTQPFNQIEAVTQASTTSSGFYGSTDTVIQSQSGQIIYPPNPAPTRPPRPVGAYDLIEGTNSGQ
jgi:hypothetical protein